MWRWIRRFIRAGEDAVGEANDAQRSGGTRAFEEIRAAVERILWLELSTEAARREQEEFTRNILLRLDREIESVRQRAEGYPAKPMAGDVWFAGAGYSGLARDLAAHFKRARWLEREEPASTLWAKATLAVCAHYPHLVGPAMLASADCHDRLGNWDRARELYASVVKDFAVLLEDRDDETDRLTDEDRIAIESLKVATDRLLARGEMQIDETDLISLQARAGELLERPVPGK